MKSAAIKKFDNLAERARKQIDISNSYKSIKDNRPHWKSKLSLCRRRRMIGSSGCSENLKKRANLVKSNERAAQRQNVRPSFIDNLGAPQERSLKSASKTYPLHNLRGKSLKETYQELSSLPLHLDKTTKSLAFRVKIGGKDFNFVVARGRNNQLNLYFPMQQTSEKSKLIMDKYVDIATKLDGDMTGPRAKAILNALTDDNNVIWETLVEKGKKVFSDEQADAARKLLLLTHVAETAPGRTPGVDKTARAMLQQIVKNPETNSFTTSFGGVRDKIKEAAFLPSRRGGVSKTKRFKAGGKVKNSDKMADAVKEHSDPSGGELRKRKRRNA
jgi:hypothetical protein